ncbi:uncharacterized protein M421DRAFT_424406 [Didymella exigua CBS 183.55]|uniref:SP-RING-type domain-containing protein n=1 Tax=Didymella exigua CBS 183.55 TaxID=1150837 RepID=A0A6A5RDZ9_9PLEO|nr:uncharacterized protein M421DRAFT_424406 [Didymella exigua CBS 183.55]KAF1924766.1 hypothetical protein M421DRAFT_424406 [Didymella exigua CBS 183.55]
MTAGARSSASGDVYDADATASTLNLALGRKHMKSWMTGAVDHAPLMPSIPHSPSILTPNPASSFKRKRGRPRKYPLPEAVDQRHATGTATFGNSLTTAPLPERLPSSNSTSPQLANIVTDRTQSRSHGNLDVTVLPSPTPSEEDAHNRGLPIHELGRRQSVNIDGFDIAHFQSPGASSPAPATAVRSPTRQDLSPQKRPAEEGSTPVEIRARVDTSQVPASTPTVMPPSGLFTFPEFPRRPSAPHAQHRSHSLGQAPGRSPSRGQMMNRQMASHQLTQTRQHSGHLPSSRSNTSPVQDSFVQNAPARQTYDSPQLNAQPFGILPSTLQFAQPTPVLPSQWHASHHDAWYTVDNCEQELISLKAKYPVTLRNRTDAIRLQVLEEAVRGLDWAYLTLHQFYCIMSYSPQDLPLTLQRNGNLYVAHSLIREVLDDNMQLSPTVLAFFCTFPFPVEYLASTWPMRYQHAEREFVGFVTYSANVGALRQASERRRVPPIPREFASCAITSLTFQRLLFRSIIRVLWGRHPHIPEKGHFEDQALSVFNRAQSVFEQQRAAGELGGRKQADSELRSWKHDFIQVTNMFEASLQRRGYQPFNPASPRLNQQQPHTQPKVHPQQRPRATPGPADLALARRLQPRPMASPLPASQTQTHLQSQFRQGSTALLPRPGLIQPQQRVPAPFRFGLHQAHLRSPVLLVANLALPSYYFWQGFVHKPQRLKSANTAVEKLSFTFSAREMDVIASAMSTAPGAADTRLIDENQKMIRLRCVKWPAETSPRDEDWAVADNSWVPYSYFSLNDVPLQLRKKLYNGKDLPIDLTGLIKKGENILEVSVMSNSTDTTFRNYLMAVEYLGVITKTSIREHCRNETLAAKDVVSDIMRKLSHRATDDDDIVLLESTIAINLRDPFSASRICDTPVRGKACLHNECFDLDTYLETRPKKGDVTAADQWRCPICKADARPTSLVMDGFLVEVRKVLELKGLLDTRAIIVSQDGSWKPKLEERDPNGVSDRDTPDPTPAAAPTAERSKSSVVHDIIDLDSD